MVAPGCPGLALLLQQRGGACQFALCCKVRMNSKLPTSTTRAISFNRHSRRQGGLLVWFNSFCEQCLSFLNWLPPQIAPVRLKQVERATHRTPCRRINPKTASPFSSRSRFFIHPFSSFPPLNAIKKIAHTPVARIRSTTKVCIFKHLLFFSTALWAANLSAYAVMVNRRVLHVSFTVDRVAI